MHSSSSSSSSSNSASSSSSSLNSSTVESFQFSPWHDTSSCTMLLPDDQRLPLPMSSPSQPQRMMSVMSKSKSSRVHSLAIHDDYDGEADADDELDDNCYSPFKIDEESPNSFFQPARTRTHIRPAEIHDNRIDRTATNSSDSCSFTSDADSTCNSRRKKQTLAELLNFHARSIESEEEESLLKSSSTQQQQQDSMKPPPRSLLVQALCGGRKSTSISSSSSSSSAPTSVSPRSSPPLSPLSSSINPAASSRLQRSNATTRRRCRNAPSPLRNSENSAGATICCGEASPIIVANTVVRSKSSGSALCCSGRPPLPNRLDQFTKSKSMGSLHPHLVQPNSSHLGKPQEQPLPKSSVPNLRSSSTTKRVGLSSSSSFPNRSSSSSGRRSSITYSFSSSSVNSSSNDSLLSAIDRYQQHKNTEAEQKKRNSYLPYKSMLLSLFFPLPSFWSHHRNVQHHHQHQHSSTVVAFR